MSIGSVLIIGAGITGVQAALDLAEAGFLVYLSDQKPAIGGRMVQLDKTFPTLDCAMCIVAPKLAEAARNPNIKLMVPSELESISGSPGNFKVNLKLTPIYVDPSKCTGCGECALRCPIEVPNEFNAGLGFRKAIYLMYPQAVPRTYAIDRQACIGCGTCREVCRANAISYDSKQELVELQVGAIIFCPGLEMATDSIRPEYGYRRYKNVVTSLEFERMLSASGPYFGQIQRASDGKIPRKIAFVQCVGSRDVNSNPYCSSVCCTYAIKQAIVAKEHIPDAQIVIFGMDLRTYGKGFEEFYNRALEQGIEFRRARVARIQELPEEDLLVEYSAGNDQIQCEKFELVVLSVGLRPSDSSRKLAQKLGISLDKFGFIANDIFQPVSTSNPGIFTCGMIQDPKDIPDSVSQASGAAALASSLIADQRGKLIARVEYPPEIDISGAPPRIGVFVCHCGFNIAGTVDVEEVANYARTLPDVVFADHLMYACSSDSLQKIKDAIKEYDLNRVIVASCSPRTHEPLFQSVLKEAGLNPYLFELVSIREHCSWVHMDLPLEATRKAKELVRMMVAKSRLLYPLHPLKSPVIPSVLIIGGGISGITAALSIADQGFQVYLIEKQQKLGGMLNKIKYLIDRNFNFQDPSSKLDQLISRIDQHPKIKLYTGANLESIEGFVGNFKSKIKIGDEIHEIQHGAIIVATGAREYVPKEYLYGQDPRVITQMELEQRIVNGDRIPDRIAMIQCVGSRNHEFPNCSRVCCIQALKNALKIKQMNPKAQIYILHRDIRSYGLYELLYHKALEEGVIFMRYDRDQEPRVSAGEGIDIRFRDPVLERDLEIEVDLLVLSAGMRPNPDNIKLRDLLKIPLTNDGFLLEAHPKLRPVEFATDGIFLCGTAHSPRSVQESIAQALGAASKALGLISKPELELEPLISEVIDANCDGCGYCIQPCPFNALKLMEYVHRGQIKKTVERNQVLCKGCGSCMATCPKDGIRVRKFDLDQLRAMVDAILS